MSAIYFIFLRSKTINLQTVCPFGIQSCKARGQQLVSYENWGLVLHIPGLLILDFSKVFSSIYQLLHLLQAHLPQIFLPFSSLTTSLFTSSCTDTKMTPATSPNSPIHISTHSFSYLWLLFLPLLLPVNITQVPTPCPSLIFQYTGCLPERWPLFLSDHQDF